MIKHTETNGVAFVPVVLGGDINVYGVVRSFYQAYGVRSVILFKRELSFSNPCNHTKLIQRRIIDQHILDDGHFVDQIRRLSEEVGVGVRLLIVPCSDDYAELVSRNQTALRDLASFATIDHDLFLQLCHKDSFYELCEQQGLPYPKTVLVNKQNFEKCRKLGFPIIIKPANPVAYSKTQYIGVKKVYIAQAYSELESIISEVYQSIYTDDLIVQEFIPGDDHVEAEVHAYSDQNGKVVFMQFNNVVLELPTPGGLGSYGTIITGQNDHVLVQAKQFLEKIKYTGFSNFDLKFDERDGEYKFFEINLRLSRSSFTMTAAGYNFARLLVEDVLCNQTIAPAVASKEILYSIIPFETALRYCSEQDIQKRMRALKDQGELHGSFWDPQDRPLVRRIAYWRDRQAWKRNFAVFFDKRRNV